MKLITDRGWTWTPANWELLLSLGPGIGAFDGGELLGTALLTQYPEAGAISGVLVGTWAARRGVGTALISNILDITAGPAVLYATPMGAPLYAKLGFHPAGSTTQYRGVFEGAATGVTRATTAADLPAVVALDREASGFSRERIWARAGEPPSSYSLRLAEFDGGPGLIGTRPGKEALTLGPVIAPTAADACAMIADVAAGAGEVRVDTGDPEVAAFLLARGFEVRTGVTLMVHGADDVPGDRARYFGPASHAFG